MKKTVSTILAAILCAACLSCAWGEAISWNYAVPLSALQTPYTALVNADHTLDSSFKPAPLINVTGVKRATSAVVTMEKTAAEALQAMFASAKSVTEYTYQTESGEQKTAKYEEGMTLYLKSGYRSYGQQATTYSNYLARNNNVDDGYVAKPGTSDHQTGLCADILNRDFANRPQMTQEFQWAPEAQWLKQNCAEFGFILRFPDGKTEETGIQFEPWHFRYVGKEAAAYIMSSGLTLEEFDAEWRAVAAVYLSGDINAYAALDNENGGDSSADGENAAPITDENAPVPDQQECYVLDEYGEDGDAEVSIVF